MDVTKVTAQLCHQVNRAFCQYLGDDSHPDWYLTAEWQRSSAVEGVKVFFSGKAGTPEEQWKAWKAHKLLEGWTYGEVKDPNDRKHPCLVENYLELPLEQRFKDDLFQTICKVMQEHATN